MGIYVAHKVVRMMARERRNVIDARILILGITFKEDCPDLRNTRVFDVYEELIEANAIVDIHDPWADVAECQREFGITPVGSPDFGSYDAIVLAVAHSQFKGAAFVDALVASGALIYDAKGALPEFAVDARL
jgi:UDP-N-acetyl-D-glucosamine/UDP-N-acetyl-D-galactosamine dehydrogenase